MEEKEQKKIEEIFEKKAHEKAVVSLSQNEIHEYGELLIERISRNYQNLIKEPDECWILFGDLNQLSKIIGIVNSLQGCKRMVIEELSGWTMGKCDI